MFAERLLLDGYPASLQVIAVALVAWVFFYLIKIYRKDRPFPGFSVIALDGKSPKETWLLNGNKAITEGLRRVRWDP